MRIIREDWKEKKSSGAVLLVRIGELRTPWGKTCIERERDREREERNQTRESERARERLRRTSCLK